jgi:CO/xanthine dehydrogenase Mo-binding subunit
VARANTPTVSTGPDRAYARIVRSSHAHGEINSVGIAAARNTPGALGVWTGMQHPQPVPSALRLAIVRDMG